MIKGTKLITFFITFLYIIIFTFSCSKNTKKEISFYHWKSKAIFTKDYEKALNTAQSNKIYMHYFDIEAVEDPNLNNDGVFPTYVLKSAVKEYQDFEIVPVVYITNQILKTKNLDITNLSNRIKKLINKISLTCFNKEIKQIQIDCDWTESTKNTYFELLKTLGKEFEIDATIRLHQIKFKERTGVPPVKNGTLMLYNVGDMKNQKQNSILESTIVKQYISSDTSYPLPLKIGLPIFSQTIVSSNDNKIKIIRNTERNLLENDNHFKKIDERNFKVENDTLYKGFYLSKGYNMKLEELKETEIIASYKIIKESKLATNEIIFYYLNDHSLSNINLTKLIEKL